VCSEATISQRILRAKLTIAEKGLEYVTPERSELRERVVSTLAVVYALFNEGHTGRTGPLMRLDLQSESLRLGRLLGELLPNEAEVFGLTAMIAFSVARAAERVDDKGVPILLAKQVRSRWDKALLREGLLELQRARSLRGRGPYVLQAEISAYHVTAPTWESTDWNAILCLYDELLEQTGSPIVALNRAIAVSMCHGPEYGLRELAALGPLLVDYHLLYATRADFLDRAGRDPLPDLQKALSLVTNDGERRLLQQRYELVTRRASDQER